jgi:hypothetical protein
MFNKQKQFYHDSLIMSDTYIVVIYAYDVNNSHSSTVWSTRVIIPNLVLTIERTKVRIVLCKYVFVSTENCDC